VVSPELALALTGASVVQYGIRLLECLVRSGTGVHLMLSRPAQVVLGLETDLRVPGRPAEIGRFFSARFGAAEGQIRCYGPEQWTAPVASGSSVPRAMVVCPCSTATVSAVATGASRSLIERAADVVLKERRKLILVVRETPFSEVHLENMLRLARMGAVIMPANPAFYHRPQTLDDLVDFMVARVLDHLDIAHDLVPRWGLEAELAGEEDV
jgi:flavin prenyltransferase